MDIKIKAFLLLILVVSTVPAVSGATDIETQVEEQSQGTSSIADVLDNDIISAVESLFSVMFLICTVYSVIQQVVTTVRTIIGFSECCKLAAASAPNPAAVAAAEAECVANEGSQKSSEIAYNFMEQFCCFVTCGWCQGRSCGFFVDFGLPLDDMYGKLGDYGIRLSPYENIYTSMACICPGAILFNLRKLKTIYHVYDCCVQEAQENGLSTEACEKQLDYATCIYWEGAMTKTMIKAVTGIVVMWLVKQLPAQWLEESVLMACISSILELATIPSTLDSVLQAWDWSRRSFDEPSCSDLGFDEVVEEIDGPNVLKLKSKGIDTDGDGVVDVLTRTYEGDQGSVDIPLRALDKIEEMGMDPDDFEASIPRLTHAYIVSTDDDGNYIQVNPDGEIVKMDGTPEGREVISESVMPVSVYSCDSHLYVNVQIDDETAYAFTKNDEGDWIAKIPKEDESGYNDKSLEAIKEEHSGEAEKIDETLENSEESLEMAQNLQREIQIENMFNRVMNVLNFALDQWVMPSVQDSICNQSWESSQSQSTSSTGSISDSCAVSDKTALAVYYLGSKEISYTVSACEGPVDYEVVFYNGQETDKEVTGHLGHSETISNNYHYAEPNDKVCIRAMTGSNTYEQCDEQG